MASQSPLAACSNCWFNGLQSGSIGMSVGFCTEYKVVLRQADDTTCARHTRKDLMLESALREKEHHKRTFTRVDGVQLVADGSPTDNGECVSDDVDFLRRDHIASIVADYGEFGTKIESLAQLRVLKTFGSELALLSLARAYTNRCFVRDKKWTSGIHLFWWTRERLESDRIPQVGPTDLRYRTSATLKDQQELASWWLVMLRLILIADVAWYARACGDQVGKLADLPEVASSAIQQPSIDKLATWIKRHGMPIIDDVFPRQRYSELANQLHTDK